MNHPQNFWKETFLKWSAICSNQHSWNKIWMAAYCFKTFQSSSEKQYTVLIIFASWEIKFKKYIECHKISKCYMRQTQTIIINRTSNNFVSHFTNYLTSSNSCYAFIPAPKYSIKLSTIFSSTSNNVCNARPCGMLLIYTGQEYKLDENL